MFSLKALCAGNIEGVPGAFVNMGAPSTVTHYFSFEKYLLLSFSGTFRAFIACSDYYPRFLR